MARVPHTGGAPAAEQAPRLGQPARTPRRPSGTFVAGQQKQAVVNAELGVFGHIEAATAKMASYLQLASLTTAERDALTAANGMVIYNSTDNKFQGYENGTWTNLI